MFHTAFEAEILRSARISNGTTNFQKISKILINQVIKQGGKIYC